MNDYEVKKRKVEEMRRLSRERKVAFQKELEIEYETVGNPKADHLFETAWNLGHSCGEAEVHNYYEDLVGLIR